MKILFLILTILVTVTAFGQGVLLANKFGEALDAPVVFAGSEQGPGPAYIAQLFVEKDNGSLVPLLPVTTFHAAGPGVQAIADRYLVSQQIYDTTVDGGYLGTFIIRVWEREYSSYEEALLMGRYVGQSDPVTVRVAGDLPPSILIGLKPFELVPVPEPAPIVLMTLFGGAALLARNRAFRLWKCLNLPRQR